MEAKNYKTIRWHDHFSDGTWRTIKEIAVWAKKRTPCVSIGEVTYEDDEVIVLSASFDGEENYGDNVCILKGNIVKDE